jgi:ubiquinone/menaquinone biosynthesis C-methylase UbiE
MCARRKQVAAELLKERDAFPLRGTRCLEVGYGRLGWLADLLSWGIREADLYGIELDKERAQVARDALPGAHLEVGDARRLPWADRHFHLVVASTLFTSVLDADDRRAVACEIARVLKPGGALLWYDFAVNSPRNPRVRRVTRGELSQLFPGMHGSIRSITLAPPLARLIVPRSHVLATLLEAVPVFRTHLIAVLTKPEFVV